ncbi:hypothetical protein C1Y41_04485 [Pantoea sp. ICBG 1758]|uniref:hypothetical protein n=1 Tax=Pantoea sp. ICBG 1758 TaxID=2071682 RepID=UPI000CE4C5C1|nr:hypothetical protein [Pantoea sp. ICBG 1758]PPC63907.1 hypothetical protein C1Y41_04485 [Pantoea sp. ICBG 1758]
MNYLEFIESNIASELLRLGFDKSAASAGAREGVAFFQRATSSGKKGKIFEDCLSHAKLFAKKHDSKKK